MRCSRTPIPRNRSRLTQAEVSLLFVRWQTEADCEAREQLVDQYLPLAYKLAARYRGANEPLSDLRQVAAMGLLKAINGFDTGRQVGFAAYAVPCILGELRRYFRDYGWSVHLPRDLQERALKVDKARQALETKHPRVTAQAIAEYLELSVEAVLEGLLANSAHHASSLDIPSSEDDEADASSLLDRFVGFEDAGFDNAEMGADIDRAALAALDESERAVLQLRFGADLTQAEIASEIGVSQMQVSRILRRALELLAAEFTRE